MNKKYMWPLMKDIVTKNDRLAMIKFLTEDHRLTAGNQVKHFEHKFIEWLHSNPSSLRKHSALFVHSGSQANLLLFVALKQAGLLKSGDKVIVPAITWGTTITPLVMLGLEPIWIDIDPKTLTMDLQQIKDALPKAKILWITHLAGLPTNMFEVKQIISDTKSNILVAEDCCQSYGAECIKNEKVKKIGTFGIGSTFSFYFGHHMTTIEGGMLVINTSNKLGQRLFNIAASMRAHGMVREIQDERYKMKVMYNNPDIDPRFLFAHLPFNMRNTEIGAVLGQQQLLRLDDFISARNDNWWKFCSECIPTLENLVTPVLQVDNCRPSSFCLPFVFKTKKLKAKFILLAEKNGFETRPLAGGVIPNQPAFNCYSKDKDFSVSNTLYDNAVYIGNNHMIESNDWIALRILLSEFSEKNS